MTCHIYIREVVDKINIFVDIFTYKFIMYGIFLVSWRSWE